MNIGINALKLYNSQDFRNAGISRYIRQLVTHLLDSDDDNAYTVFVNHLMSEWQEPTRRAPALVRSRPLTGHPVPRIAWEQMVLPLYTARGMLDVLHCPLNVVPLGAACPTVLTIHDLTFLAYPHHFHAAKRTYLTLFTQLSARRAGMVVADSASTKDDIVRHLGVPEKKVQVIYPAADADFKPASPKAINRFKASQGLDGPYILYVGTLEPRKNVDVLVRAYAELVRRHHVPHRLVLAGGRGWMTGGIAQAIAEEGVEDRVLRPGYVARASLPLWYNSADLFIYPSSYEGFGYPVLEAMASGTPVITTRASSLPEVAGQAGMLVTPRSQDEMVEAMAAVLLDPATADTCRTRGLEQAQRFSWHASAQQFVSVYKAVGRSRSH